MILNNAEMLINHIRDLIYVQKIIREIRESSSLAEKKFILAQHKNNENLKAVIKYAYSPDINFGDNVVENIINLPESNTLDDVYSVWYMLDKLASNNTNSYIKQEFKDYMAFFPDIEELITGIITKDLNLGMSIVSINKILKVLDLDSSQLAISNWFHK